MLNEVNRRAREEAGAARQPRAGGPEDLLVGEATTGDDDDADVGGLQVVPTHGPRSGECRSELELAILEGLRTQLQVDGKMEVCSVGPHFTNTTSQSTRKTLQGSTKV